jgi:hypothetical protein
MNEQHFDDGALDDQMRRFYQDVYGSVGTSDALWSTIASQLDGEQFTMNDHVTFVESTTADKPTPRARITPQMRFRRFGTAVAVLLAGLIVVASIALFHTLHSTQPGTHVTSQTQTPTGCSPATIKLTLPHNAEIADLVLTGPTSGWAVGSIYDPQQYVYQQSLILQLKDCRWSPADPTLPQVAFTAVSMISPDEGWMIGYDHIHSAPLLLHLIDGQWHVTTPTYSLAAEVKAGYFYSISMLSATEGWMMEELPKTPDGQTHQLLLHLHGGIWSVITTPFVGEFDIIPIAPDDAWIAATGPAPMTGSTSLLYHYQQGRWTAAHVPTAMSIQRLHLNAPNDAWASGDFTSSSGDSPALLHYNGTIWSQVALNLRNPAQELFMLSATDGWAFGRSGEFPGGPTDKLALIQRYVNGQWITVGLPPPSISDILQITCGAAEDCWAIGMVLIEQTAPDGRGGGYGVTKLLHYVNGQWTAYSAS